MRALAFAARLEDPVANVTLDTTPALITRQRQNLGRTRSRGLELDGSLRLASRVWASLGYAFTDATVRSFEADRSLEGNDVLQVAQHQGRCRCATPTRAYSTCPSTRGRARDSSRTTRTGSA